MTTCGPILRYPTVAWPAEPVYVLRDVDFVGVRRVHVKRGGDANID
jgi:hypothetical protein